MSATHRNLGFSAVVRDPDKVPQELKDICDRLNVSVDDYVAIHLELAMAVAGQRFIDSHPDWFQEGTGLV